MELTIEEYKKLNKNTKPKQKFIDILTKAGAVPEFKFSKDRKFRADFALINERILIEYEGIYGKTSRHTTHSGFSKDCEKYNLAALEGWRVLRYTAKNIKNLQGDLDKILLKTTIY